MKRCIGAMLLGLLLLAPVWAQTPTQIKQVIPTTASLTFSWDYLTADEASIDSFVLQRTIFGATTTITSPYAVEQVVTPDTLRQVTFTMPTPQVTAGQKAFFRMVARKVGLADSNPSNVVEVDVLATPPAPTNLRFP